MKRALGTILTAALLFSLAACTSSESGTRAPEPASPEDQIALIAASKDQWMAEDGAYTPFYAVTDLD